MRILCPLIVALTSTFFVRAQSKIDTLKETMKAGIKTDNKEYVANYLGQIGYEFLLQAKYDSAISYLLKSIHTSVASADLAGSNYNSLGVAYNNKGVPDSALYYYNSARAIYYQQKDTTRALTIENNMAIIYKNQGLYEEALETVLRALNKLEKMPSDRTLASGYNTVAGVYAKMDDQVNALRFYKKSFEIRKAIQFERGIGQSYHNIGETYLKMRLYDSALFNLFRSMEIERRLNDSSTLGTTLNFVGLVFLKQLKYAQAEPYFRDAIRIKNAAGERLDEGMALINLAELKLATGDLKSAEQHVTAAENLIRKTAALDQLQKCLELKVLLYKAKREAPLALKAMDELAIVKDSLLTKEKLQSLLSMQIRYETEKKEQQIELLKQQQILKDARLESRETWITALIITIVLMAVIVVLGFNYYKSMKRNKEHVEILLKELHHRVKNNLQLLSSIFSLQSLELTDQKAIQAVRSSEARINAMALIHRKLYNTEQNRSINMKDYLNELVVYLMYAYGHTEESFRVSANLKDIHLDVDKAIPLGLIMNELISNSFKYAYSDQPNPELHLILYVQNNNNLYINLGDNGKGIDAKTLAENDSFGLKMVTTFINQLQGKIETKNDPGTMYTLIIPL